MLVNATSRGRSVLQPNLANRKRCANVYWRKGRKVRILDPAFGYKNKIGLIQHVGAEFVYVRIVFSKKPGDHDEVAYPPEHLWLI